MTAFAILTCPCILSSNLMNVKVSCLSGNSWVIRRVNVDLFRGCVSQDVTCYLGFFSCSVGNEQELRCPWGFQY